MREAFGEVVYELKPLCPQMSARRSPSAASRSSAMAVLWSISSVRLLTDTCEQWVESGGVACAVGRLTRRTGPCKPPPRYRLAMSSLPHSGPSSRRYPGGWGSRWGSCRRGTSAACPTPFRAHRSSPRSGRLGRIMRLTRASTLGDVRHLRICREMVSDQEFRFPVELVVEAVRPKCVQASPA